MKIGIDARLIEETGVGRYIRNLIRELAGIDTKNNYVVFLRKKSFDSFQLPDDRWQKRLADIPWHTVQEQFVMPDLLLRERLDLVHVPYHNPPIFYPKNMIVTIHDLTILHMNTGRATTLPSPLYKLKRMGYSVELAVGLKRAKKIITVSGQTKKELVRHFGLHPEKIEVTYEAADESIVKHAAKAKKPLISGSYVLYVGNAYPHKNLHKLLEAWQMIPDGKLVLATPDDFFSQQLKQHIQKMSLDNRVHMFGHARVEELANLYRWANVLVFPSLMEGFGLPGVEAMAVGTPVICSDIPVFREIYGDATLMFNPKDTNDIANKIKEVIENEKLRKSLIEKGKKQAAKYSWLRMAEQTLEIYQSH